jgi:hypothetical protein
VGYRFRTTARRTNKSRKTDKSQGTNRGVVRLGVGHNGGRNRHGEGPNPMENASFLRRQAEFCLRLSQLCTDALVVDHLTRKAAQYHEEALRTEFELGSR